MFLEKINGPDDVRKLHREDLQKLAEEMGGEPGADQITFRALRAPDANSEQGKWIQKHVTTLTMDFIAALKAGIMN